MKGKSTAYLLILCFPMSSNIGTPLSVVCPLLSRSGSVSESDAGPCLIPSPMEFILRS